MVYMMYLYMLKLLKLGSIKPFIAKAMEPPSSEAVEHAIETLFDLVSVAALFKIRLQVNKTF